ncbi:MAG: acyl-CoA dehydrogenase [Novosphingobium sp.]|nr:acyl-CoA dehydrogenase [Novosphingobium sp.]
MDLALTADQRALREAIVQIVSDNLELPRDKGVVTPRTWHHAERLERDLAQGGYFGIARAEGCGALEAAILVYEAGFSPQVFECAASALIAPLLADEDLPRPVAVARLADLTRGVRFLDTARTLIVDLGEDVAILPMAGLTVIPVASQYAVPLGKLAVVPDLSGARRLGAAKVPELRRLWRLALALEIGAALQAGIDFTNAYVKQRQVFSRPVGSFQAVQHRLSADVEKARGVYWLAMKAAWSGDARDAALAALHAQRACPQVVYDLHQFNGALGMTLEHALHCWTFRLRWLAGEMGGARAQAAEVARLAWGEIAA